MSSILTGGLAAPGQKRIFRSWVQSPQEIPFRPQDRLEVRENGGLRTYSPRGRTLHLSRRGVGCPSFNSLSDVYHERDPPGSVAVRKCEAHCDEEPLRPSPASVTWTFIQESGENQPNRPPGASTASAGFSRRTTWVSARKLYLEGYVTAHQG